MIDDPPKKSEQCPVCSAEDLRSRDTDLYMTPIDIILGYCAPLLITQKVMLKPLQWEKRCHPEDSKGLGCT